MNSVNSKKTFRYLPASAAVLLCSLLSACSLMTTAVQDQTTLLQTVSTQTGKDLQLAAAPSFMINDPLKPYNRIGTPGVRYSVAGTEEVYVDPFKGAVYVDKKRFRTRNGVYENYIYRIHFEKVPFGYDEYHLTAGNNVGLIVILTQNQENETVLITTVHTCGCFLTFLPTDKNNKEQLTDDWTAEEQKVFGKKLPAFIHYPSDNKNGHLVIHLEGASHRVVDIELRSTKELNGKEDQEPLDVFAMETLWHLEGRDREVSFFETEGPRKGYVKNSGKILERLLMSWWAFDWYIGEDKDLGDYREDGVVFYTSLKFWDRRESDLRNFSRFLRYWGWKL